VVRGVVVAGLVVGVALVGVGCAPPSAPDTTPVAIALPGGPVASEGEGDGEGEGEGDGEGDGEGEGEGEGDGEGDGHGEGDGEGAPSIDGATWYRTLCAGCHGAAGEGRTGPALSTWTDTRAALFVAIDGVMPAGTPAACDGAWARAVTDYVFDHLRGRAADRCAGLDEDGLLPPRGLRLLTRDEFRSAVLDLLRLRGGPCAGDDDCADGGVCGDDARCRPPVCGTTTFPFDPPGAGATRIQFAYLLDQLRQRPDPAVDGATLLDTSVVLACSEVSDGNTHSHDDLPFLLGGRAGGALSTGRALDLAGERHHKLLTSVANLCGAGLRGFGDGEGSLAGLSARRCPGPRPDHPTHVRAREGTRERERERERHTEFPGEREPGR
jgi:hypothetical protein